MSSIIEVSLIQLPGFDAYTVKRQGNALKFGPTTQITGRTVFIKGDASKVELSHVSHTWIKEAFEKSSGGWLQPMSKMVNSPQNCIVPPPQKWADIDPQMTEKSITDKYIESLEKKIALLESEGKTKDAKIAAQEEEITSLKRKLKFGKTKSSVPSDTNVKKPGTCIVCGSAWRGGCLNEKCKKHRSNKQSSNQDVPPSLNISEQ